MANPFAVVSPEEMKAEKAAQLFVEMYSDYPQIKRPGNIIMTGARGCGKTMLIRCYSTPDDKITAIDLKDFDVFHL